MKKGCILAIVLSKQISNRTFFYWRTHFYYYTELFRLQLFINFIESKWSKLFKRRNGDKWNKTPKFNFMIHCSLKVTKKYLGEWLIWFSKFFALIKSVERINWQETAGLWKESMSESQKRNKQHNKEHLLFFKTFPIVLFTKLTYHNLKT